MAQRRRFSAEYKREAVAMLESPGCDGESDRGGGRDWGQHARALTVARCVGRRPKRFRSGRPREEEMESVAEGVSARDEGAGFFCEKRPRSSRARRKMWSRLVMVQDHDSP